MRWRLACLLCWACCCFYIGMLVHALSQKQGVSILVPCAGAALPWVLLAFWCNARANGRG